MLNRCVAEAIRMYSPGIIVRKAAKDFKLGNYIIAAGDDLCLSLYLTHRDPEIYPEPEKFNPERFSEENVAKRKRHTYIPFGIGFIFSQN